MAEPRIPKLMDKSFENDFNKEKPINNKINILNLDNCQKYINKNINENIDIENYININKIKKDDILSLIPKEKPS